MQTKLMINECDKHVLNISKIIKSSIYMNILSQKCNKKLSLQYAKIFYILKNAKHFSLKSIKGIWLIL